MEADHFYFIDGIWGKEVSKQLRAIKGKDEQKKAKPAAQRAQKKTKEFAGASQPKEEQKSSAAIPEDRKPIVKALQDEAKKEALSNIGQYGVKHGYEKNIDLKEFKQAVSKDAYVYNIAARQLLNMAKHGANPEELNELNDFLNQRAKTQIIATIDGSLEDKNGIFESYFAARPSVLKRGLPSASDFGRMRPKDKLQYLTSSSTIINAMNLLDKGYYKVVFNPNHLKRNIQDAFIILLQKYDSQAKT